MPGLREQKIAKAKVLIQECALRLFAEQGYSKTTVEQIAEAAEVSSSTFFRYFQTKEAIVAALACEAIGDAHADPETQHRKGATFQEDLFALVASGLRKLKPLRKHLPALLETSLSPLASTPHDEASSLRVAHLEAVAALAARHGFAELSATNLQLYWTLYTGVLVFWANDRSPRQEDTLALIDDSVNMFVGWMRRTVQIEPPPAHR